MNKEEVLQKLRLNLPDFKKKYPIETMGIFGSVARGDASTNSDLDILVQFNGAVGLEFIDLADELEQRLNCKVDLVSRRGIKPKYWESIKEDVIYV